MQTDRSNGDITVQSGGAAALRPLPPPSAAPLSATDVVVPLEVAAPSDSAVDAIGAAVAAARRAATSELSTLVSADLGALGPDGAGTRPATGEWSDVAWAEARWGEVIERLTTRLLVHDERDDPRRSPLVAAEGALPARRLLVDHPGGVAACRVAGATLGDELDRGATVVLREVDERDRGIGRIAELLELHSGARVAIDLRLSGPTDGHADGVVPGPALVWCVAGASVWSLVGADGDAMTLSTSARSVVCVPPGWAATRRSAVGDDADRTAEFVAHVRRGDVVHASVRAALDTDLALGTVPTATDLLAAFAVAAATEVAAGARAGSRALPRPADLDAARSDGLRHRAPAGSLRVSAPGGVAAVAGTGDRDTPPDLAFCGRRWHLDRRHLEVLAQLLVAPVPLDRIGSASPHGDDLVRLLLADGVAEVVPDGSARRPAAVDRAVPVRFAPVRPELVEVTPASSTSGRPRPFDASDEVEARLAVAAGAGRSAAHAELTAMFSGGDLAASLSAVPHRPATWRLTAPALDALLADEALDDLFGFHHLEPGLVVVARNGDPVNRALPPGVLRASARPAGPRRLSPGAVDALSAVGVTLIALTTDRSVPAFDRFAGLLERVAARRVGANLYVSRDVAPGFGAHWDDHDVLVVQLAGRKHWEVFEPADERPLLPFTPMRVSDRVAWSGQLVEGDVLYVPRGWGHRIEGREGRSVHVTMSLRGATAHTVAALAADHLAGDAAVRADLVEGAGSWEWPVTAGAAVVDEVAAGWQALVPARGHVPLWATGDGTAVSLAVAGACAWIGGPDRRRRLAMGDRVVAYEPAVLPVLERLLCAPAWTPAALADGLAPDAVAATIASLSRAGLLVVGDAE